MRALYDPARHEPLGDLEWSAPRARDAIAAICGDTEAAFDPNRLWPLHPGDDEPGTPDDGVLRGLYAGAAGMLHALGRLTDAGLHAPRLDGARVVGDLHEAALVSADEAGAGESLYVGSSGILLVAHRLAPSRTVADALAHSIAQNAQHPSNELVLGAPGTMLAARAMHARTGEERFADLWRVSARALLGRQEADDVWTQDLYGHRDRYIGAGHGFAGNMRVLCDAPEWLDDATAVEARAVATARALAVVDGALASWPTLKTDSPADPPPRVQWCHGAAGGELVWCAGPVARNAGLCHGTAGNGFAFLALFARTGDERWLERARAFAMHALEQIERLRAEAGRGHYTLFTGDVGAALLAAACLRGDAAFPGVDDL